MINKAIIATTFLFTCSVQTLANDHTEKHITSHYSPKAKNWYQSAEEKIAKKVKALKLEKSGAAKNIILFVGDGMGISTITAARILAGQKQGLAGEEYELAFDKFPYSGLSRTYNTNQQTPDSAGTMTAMITGVKTKAGVLSISQEVTLGDCDSGKNRELFSALQLAELAGKSTGIVSTARITHATPGATYAHSASRSWEDISEMPASAVKKGCKDIAQQLVNFENNLKARFPNANVNGIEVILGGGRRHFLPVVKNAKHNMTGNRTDGRNLIEEWQLNYPSGKVVFNSTGLTKLNSDQRHVLGLFTSSHMHYDADREKQKLNEPSLAAMTEKAITMLSKNKNGFFLMVEAGRIDHAHHAGNAFNALNDVIALSEAVDVATKKTQEDDTLIIVTADHSHVFTMAGYPTRGNPILGKVISNDEQGKPKSKPELATDGKPYTTLGYMNGLGFADYGDECDADVRYEHKHDVRRHDISRNDTTAPGYHQEAFIPTRSETHGGEDVAIYARGPGAILISGSHEQNYIFHVMNYSGALEKQAIKAIK